MRLRRLPFVWAYSRLNACQLNAWWLMFEVVEMSVGVGLAWWENCLSIVKILLFQPKTVVFEMFLIPETTQTICTCIFKSCEQI